MCSSSSLAVKHSSASFFIMEVQVHLLLLLSVILSSDAEKEKNLTAIEGGSITFPQPVLQRGSLIYGGLNIAMVTERKAEIPRDPWKDKVHWNNTTGFFTITELQTSDSGIYSVDAMNGDAAVYKLTVFVIISSNAETEKNLTAIEGGSITFPQPVFQLGSLIYGGMNIAMVTERKANIPRDPWKDKVHWNNTTGIFTITELQTSDSGIYTVHAMNGDAAFYKLTVFVAPAGQMTQHTCRLWCFLVGLLLQTASSIHLLIESCSRVARLSLFVNSKETIFTCACSTSGFLTFCPGRFYKIPFAQLVLQPINSNANVGSATSCASAPGSFVIGEQDEHAVHYAVCVNGLPPFRGSRRADITELLPY
ncbi:uncharacterized protein LOC142880634 isoform X4 [Nelusetta ayraudi]|uniref:uncharacterized protein LOC142880634 isoform X4 n=1 Tax=Nelusetta ayraudi TaxID=303726 RepID=UPI003F70F85F